MRDKNTLIAVPALDVMPVQSAYSLLNLKKDCPSRFSFIVRASCHDARNLLAREAIESNADQVLWIDSDMVFGEDLLIRLSETMEAEEADMVCGLYFKRELPVTPTIYRDINAESGKAEAYLDYPKDSVFPVAGCGFAAVLTTVQLLKDVYHRWGELFYPMTNLSEDLSFCWRASRVGARIVCDSRIKVGHVGQIVYDERMYRRAIHLSD